LGQHLKPVQAAAHQHHRVVHVAAIPLQRQAALAKLVKAVEVHICKCLAQQIANGYAGGLGSVGEKRQQTQCALALDVPGQQGPKGLAVNAVEEFAHINVQRPGCTGGKAHHLLRPVGGFVRTFANAASKAGVDVFALKHWRNGRVHGVLHHQVAKGGGFNQPGFFALVHPKAVARLWCVAACSQLCKQVGDVAAQVFVKLKRGPV